MVFEFIICFPNELFQLPFSQLLRWKHIEEILIIGRIVVGTWCTDYSGWKTPGVRTFDNSHI